MTQYRILPESVLQIIEDREWSKLKKVEWPDYELCSSELAEHFEDLKGEDCQELFSRLPEKLKIRVFADMTAHNRLPVFETLKRNEKVRLLNNLDPDDLSEFIQEYDEADAQDIMTLLRPEEKEETEDLLQYPPESVGRMMTPDYMSIQKDWTVEEVFDHLRKKGEDRETLSTLYVCDEKGALMDALSLNKIVLAPLKTRVSDLMDETVLTITPEEDREVAVELMQQYDRLVLPVVDEGKHLLGIVTIDDIMDIAQDEATEDFQLQAAVSPLGKGYWDTKLSGLLKSRLPWLGVLIIVNLLSSGIIAAFEESLAIYVGLAFFIPLLIDAGGNSGSQSAMMMIRALSTGDVKADQWARIFFRELICGAMIGLTLGLMGAALGYFRGGSELALVLFLSLFLILIVTNLTGVVLPFILTVVKVDPAVASGPLITTVSDALGLLIYFNVAVMVLGI
ncbi:MAG: magnesium transporter [Spirochaetales bacterium]|nr:magnesium transporter [Spirochaetales bacterium]